MGHIGLTVCKSETNDVFEFGVDKGRVSFSEVGSIGLFEKIKKIPIKIPYCMKLTFVRVEVDNSLGPPVVTLDYGLLMTTIRYRPLQHSSSTYSVIAKAIPYCMDLTYVNVAVDNPVGPPVVSLDRDLYVVTIKYRESQKSASTYSVTAKTVPIKQCYDFNNDGY
ncbi:uncharacterized protein LOC114353878 [Ostrinia furnacalis]|uniref:uncharacterized protein LOC114353878 n=1 Tax=Ostrinia furnacalis TaxID=93504 RepID=UPI0010405F84|nr:uncharacterized protein LOC114353878 [Ostrinia furnacalis]